MDLILRSFLSARERAVCLLLAGRFPLWPHCTFSASPFITFSTYPYMYICIFTVRRLNPIVYNL